MARSDTSPAALDQLPSSWHDVLEDLGYAPREEASTRGERLELISKFADRGFVRLLLSPGAAPRTIALQVALPVDDAERPRYLDALRTEFEAMTPFEWSSHRDDMQSTLEADEEPVLDREDLAGWLQRVSDLVDFVTSADREGEPAWLRRRLDTSSAETGSERSTGRSRRRDSDRERETSSRSGEDASSRTRSDGVFETIGDGGSEEVLRGEGGERAAEARIDGFEIESSGESIDVIVRLQRDQSEAVVERIGRGLAHAVRARFDASARPLDPGDVETKGDYGASRHVWLKLEPADWGREHEDLPDHLEDDVAGYLERLIRFDDLGVSLGETLGLDDSSSVGEASSRSSRRSGRRSRGDASGRRGDAEPDDRSPESTTGSTRDRGGHADRDGRETGARRTRDESEEGERSSTRKRSGGRSSRRRSEDEATPSADAAETSDDEIVLGGPDDEDEREPAEPETGLTPGDYTDPRLMREDATTSLVDVVLRHPGYAEEKMGHNVSILLGIDFPEAMELIETAPRVIAWGVGRDRATRFKRVIEQAGGKVVLVEPDSLQDSSR